jgi:hypothetical protein
MKGGEAKGRREGMREGGREEIMCNLMPAGRGRLYFGSKGEAIYGSWEGSMNEGTLCSK